MDLMVLCRCGHASGLHAENGCRAGRYQPCRCPLDSHSVIETATAAVRTQTQPWRQSESNTEISK
jgi:hypothetical protein